MKKTILGLSDSPFLNTGYSSQMLALLNGLYDKGWDCHYQVAGPSYMGQTIPPNHIRLADETPFKFTLYSHGRDDKARDLIIPRINTIKPSIFLTLQDTFMLHPWFQTMNFNPALSSFWFPSDGGRRLPLGCEHLLASVHIPVAMSKFAQKQVLDKHGIKSHYIPHSVDSKLFYPVSFEDKQKLKEKWGLNKRFVVGIAGRNQNRKFHSEGIKVFAGFAKRHPDAVLLMHLDPNDVATPFDINTLASDLGILNRVFYTKVKYYEGFPYQQMNEVYNLMDAYLSSTSGEGFGIMTAEAMACEIPVLITDYTCFDNATEISTPEGLKHISELKEGDMVWSKNFSTNQLEAKPIEKVISKQYSGKMIHIKNRYSDLLLTPDHNVFVQQPLSYNKWSNWKKIKAQQLLERSHWKLPLTAKWVGECPNEYIDLSKNYVYKNKGSCPEKIKTKDFLELAGWYVAEGFIQQDRRCNVLSIIGICEPQGTTYHKEICQLLKRIGIKFSETKSQILFNSTRLAQALTEFGCGAKNKRIPGWVKALNKEYLNIFWLAMNKGDGSKLSYDNFVVYTTISKILAIDLCEVCLKLGIGSKIRTEIPSTSVYQGRKITSKNLCYRVQMRYKELEGYIAKFKGHIKEEYYSGEVWCISVQDNANLLVCRNGIFTFCGNTSKEIVIDNGVGPAGELIKLLAELTGSMNVERGLIDIADGIEKLERMYFDYALRQKYGKNGRKAVLQNYSPELVVNYWDSLLQEVLGKQ